MIHHGLGRDTPSDPSAHDAVMVAKVSKGPLAVVDLRTTDSLRGLLATVRVPRFLFDEYALGQAFHSVHVSPDLHRRVAFLPGGIVGLRRCCGGMGSCVRAGSHLPVHPDLQGLGGR